MNVVVTGASAGIGAELAKVLGGRGHRLVLAARREAELKAVASASGEAHIVVADVSVRADVNRLRDEAVKTLGHVDVWINNAGRGITKPALQLDDADVDEMIQVNLKSVLYAMQAIAPHFIERKRGHIINISSALARMPMASIRSAYSAAKAAMNNLSASVRAELAAVSPDIRVSVVMPGMVATEFARNTRGFDAAGPPRSPPPGIVAQSALEVAEAIAAIVDKPRAESYTNPTSAEGLRRYEASLSS